MNSKMRPASRKLMPGSCGPSHAARSGFWATRTSTLSGELSEESGSLSVNAFKLRLSEGFDTDSRAGTDAGSGAPRTSVHRAHVSASVSFVSPQTAHRHGSRTSGTCDAPQDAHM